MRSNRGSMFVEAAIAMPLFICLVLVMVVLIKACLIQILVCSAVSDKCDMYGAGKVLFLELAVKDEIKKDGLDASELSLKQADKSVTVNKIEGFEEYTFTFDTKFNLPIQLKNTIFVNNTMTTRKWEGNSLNGQPFGFDRMAVSEDGSVVYVFTDRGEKYHQKSCRYVESYAEQTVLSGPVRKKYDRCPLCTSGKEADGQEVFIFQYGTSYHLEECRSVTKYFTAMDIADAELKGYTACTVCGG